MNSSSRKKNNLDIKLFIPTISITFILLAFAVIMPEKTRDITGSAMKWVTHDLGWIVAIFGLGTLLFLLWLAFGKYGNVVLGKEGEKPEFSKTSYAFMMFTAGVGASLIFWAVGEPMTYLQAPPQYAAFGSPESFKWVVSYAMMHWGPIGWAIFCLPSVPFAYYLHKRENSNLRASSLLSDLIGKQFAKGWIGYIIDIIATVATLGAFSTSMGFTVDLLGAGISKLTNIPNNLILQVSIILTFAIFYGFVMYAGIKKGVEKVSNISVYVALILGGFILVVGPTSFIMNYFVDNLGTLSNNFITMALWTDPIQKSGFPQAWTQYYWLWYAAYFVMMGLFLARISKGRTIKELIVTCIVSGSAGCTFFISTFGGFSVNAYTEGVPIVEWINKLGLSATIIKVIEDLPLGGIFLIVFLLVEFFLMSTTMTSATYSVAMMTTKELDMNADPDRNIRMLWTFGVTAVSLAAFFMGGAIDTIKSMTVAVGIPMIILYILSAISLIKWLKEDFPGLKSKKMY